MPVEIICPNCGQRLRVAATDSKAPIHCPSCRTAIRVKTPAEAKPTPQARPATDSKPAPGFHPPPVPSAAATNFPRSPARRDWWSYAPWTLAGVSIGLGLLVTIILLVRSGSDDGRTDAAPLGAPLDASNTVSGDPLAPEVIFSTRAGSVVTVARYNTEGLLIGHGTGFFVDPELLGMRRSEQEEFEETCRKLLRKLESSDGVIGLVVTNYHVVKDLDDSTIHLKDGRVGEVLQILGEDLDKDLALLMVSYEGKKAPSIPLAPERPDVGAKAYTLGSPKGFDWTFSDGVVSGFRIIRGVSHLQTDANISRGSSGGPLLDAWGGVLGVVRMQYSEGQNLNFAVDGSEVKEFLTTQRSVRVLQAGRQLGL